MTRAKPPVTFEVDIDEEQVAFFREHGWLKIDRLVSDEELEWLRATYEEIFAARQGGFPGGAFDVTRRYDEDPSEAGGHRFTQILGPEITNPELRDTEYVRNGRRIAARLLERPEGELTNWGHLLTKPATIGYEAPWHQDEAYWDPGQDYVAVGAWMPLDDATVDNGCLWFVPGSHQGPVLAHKHLGDDPSVHLLELDEEVDTSTAVAVPVAAGGVTFHHARTLHHSRPNTTGRDRRAYANEFQTVPVRREVDADRPWFHEGTEAFAATSHRGA